MQSLEEPEEPGVTAEAVVVIDGKTVRRSGDEALGLPRAHVVSARQDCSLVVGRTLTGEKTGELTAMRELLGQLEWKDRIVTIDAQGRRTDVARSVAQQCGWYLLAIKPNQEGLHANLVRDFACLDETGGEAAAHDRFERAHGRRERRTCNIMGVNNGILDGIDPERRQANLAGAVRVLAKRTAGGRTTTMARCYITNLPLQVGARMVADLARGHWGIENSLHWVLDDTFQEDRCRLRRGHSTRNMAALRRVAMNLLTCLKGAVWPKLSVRRLRKTLAHKPAALEPIML